MYNGVQGQEGKAGSSGKRWWRKKKKEVVEVAWTKVVPVEMMKNGQDRDRLRGKTNKT